MNIHDLYTSSRRAAFCGFLITLTLGLAKLAGAWGFDNHAWDVAGGVVLIREAGGQVTNVDGSTYDPFTPDALASNGPLHPVLLEVFRQGAQMEISGHDQAS